MAEIEVEESYETTTVTRRKTVRQSIKIEEVSNVAENNPHQYPSGQHATH